MKEIENYINELEVTKETNSDDYWKGVVVGLRKAIIILNKPRVKVSQKQLEAEKFVDRYIQENGHPPTYREVAKELNLSSTNTAFHRLRHCRFKMIRKN